MYKIGAKMRHVGPNEGMVDPSKPPSPIIPLFSRPKLCIMGG